MTTQAYVGTLVAINCATATCGVTFGLDDAHRERLRETHKAFYCPNGHTQWYPGESDKERLQRLLRNEQARAANLRDDLNVEKASHRSTRMQLGKVKKRVVHGVCPVQGCHRSFRNLREHIERVHPSQLVEHT